MRVQRALFGVLLCGACGRLSTSVEPLAAPTPTSSPSAEGAHVPFVPQAEVHGGRAHLHVTFPDGSEGDLSYPAELDLAGLGVQPDVTLIWENNYYAMVLTHGGLERSILEQTEQPVVYRRPSGSEAELYKARHAAGPYRTGPNSTPSTHWLVFRLSDWTVHVPVPPGVGPQELVNSVRPWESSNGFPAVAVTGPAELSHSFGEAGGGQIAFGELSPFEVIVQPSEEGPYVQMSPDGCSRAVRSIRPGFGVACLNGEIYLSVTIFHPAEYDRNLIEEVVDGVQLEKFRASG